MMLVGKTFSEFANVSMLGNLCVVSQYPQFHYQHLEKCQLLPCPYLVSFEDSNGGKYIREKWLLDLRGESEKIVWDCI